MTARPAAIDLSASRSECTHLIDFIAGAQVTNGPGGFVSVHQSTINNRSRPAIFQHPDSEIVSPELRTSGKTQLLFGIGIRESCWDRMGDPVEFQVELRIGAGAPIELFRRALFPRGLPADRDWIDAVIDLPELGDAVFSLALRTKVIGGGNASYCWAAWADPRLRAPRKLRPARKPGSALEGGLPPDVGHVFIITADALRRDCLGCYGDQETKTPHIDALAEDGTLLLDARSVTSTTPGGYLSLLSGLYPPSHGMHTEWGKAPEDIATIPSIFARSGYHSVMLASEGELSDPQLGLSYHFGQVGAEVGIPFQEGAITTRALQRMIERAERPTVFWTQYFDVHPPAVPPVPYERMYYSGDPRDPGQTFRPDLVSQIRGMETVLEFRANLPWLLQGRVDYSIIARLTAAAAALRGEGGAAPDLAAHLFALPIEARLGLGVPEFADWLTAQVESLRRSVVSDELVAWMRLILRELEVVEEDILSWLRGVTDFRFPIAQYRGAVSYFDRQVGDLVECLKDAGLYESSTIIVTSPHGEIFDEGGMCFSHHALRDSVLRIPLVIKMPRSTQCLPGARIAGRCESIDVLPTLAAALLDERAQQHADLQLPGRSLLANMRSGAALAERDTFATDQHQQAIAIRSGPYELQLVQRDHFLSESWNFRAGERMLFEPDADPDRVVNLIHHRPEIAADLERKLTDWQQRFPNREHVDTGEMRSSLFSVKPQTAELAISFIIANFNRLDRLQECLASFETTLPPISHEVIIVDDCSTDGSAEFIRSLSAPYIGIINEKRLGFAANNNKGAALARGKVLCLLNNDLVLRPGWLEPMLTGLRKCNRAGIIGNIQLHPLSGRIDHIGVSFNAAGAPANYGENCKRLPRRAFSEWPAVTAACCMIDRDLFFAVGGFDEGFKNGFEDVDLCLRLRRIGLRNYVANRSVIGHYAHSSHGRFSRESENVRRLLDRWQHQGKLMSKLCPPPHFESLRSDLTGFFVKPRETGIARFAKAVSGYARYELKKRVYRLFFAKPHVFPKYLRSRFGSA